MLQLGAQEQFAITGAVLHIGNGEVIQNGFLGVQNGKIVEVLDLSKPQTSALLYDTVYQMAGKHVYPGFILMNNVLGLTEVDAVRATLDFEEPFPFTPEVRAAVAFNAESSIPPTLVRNGVLYVQSTPRGAFLAGQSSVLRLNGEPYTRSRVEAISGLHLYWPRVGVATKGSGSDQVYSEKFQQYLQQLQEMMLRAKNVEIVDGDMRQEVLKQVLEGKIRMYLHASGAFEIRQGILFCEQAGIPAPVLVGGEGLEPLIPWLKEKNIPVILTRVYELPPGHSDPSDYRCELARSLKNAGILFAIDYAGDMEAMGGRNLAFTAGYLTGAGFSDEEALRAISYDAARILGLEQQIGSLQVNREASFIVSEGIALEILSHQILHAWIAGQRISLHSHQEELMQRFTH